MENLSEVRNEILRGAMNLREIAAFYGVDEKIVFDLAEYVDNLYPYQEFLQYELN